MFVIRLASGNLLVPEHAVADGGRLLGDAYVEIGPDHPDYPRLAGSAGETAMRHYAANSSTTSLAMAPKAAGTTDGSRRPASVGVG
jgi:hypothetical protein